MTFADVKVGDQVIIDPPGFRARCRRICKVEKVTATQCTASGYRFSKSNGWQIGGDKWRPAYVKAATPELIKEVQLDQRYKAAQNALRQRITKVELLCGEIDQNHDCHKWTATLEEALIHLTAAADVLNACQTEVRP